MPYKPGTNPVTGPGENFSQILNDLGPDAKMIWDNLKTNTLTTADSAKLDQVLRKNNAGNVVSLAQQMGNPNFVRIVDNSFRGYQMQGAEGEAPTAKAQAKAAVGQAATQEQPQVNEQVMQQALQLSGQSPRHYQSYGPSESTMMKYQELMSAQPQQQQAAPVAPESPVVPPVTEETPVTPAATPESPADQELASGEITEAQYYNEKNKEYAVDKADAERQAKFAFAEALNRGSSFTEARLLANEVGKKLGADKDAPYLAGSSTADAWWDKRSTVGDRKNLLDAETEAGDALTAATNAGRMVTGFEDYHDTWRRAGAIGNFYDWIDRQTGGQEKLQLIKTQFEGFVASQLVNNLPPGVASDKDIELVKRGFPDSSWNPKRIVEWLKAYRRAQLKAADFAQFKSEWIYKNNGRATGVIKAYESQKNDRWSKINFDERSPVTTVTTGTSADDSGPVDFDFS